MPSSPPLHSRLPARVWGIPEETEQHPLTSETRPVLIRLPASINPRVSLEDTFTLWLFLSVLFQTSGKGPKGT